MRIGQLARDTATSIGTIRFYESEGLLAPPPRTSSNFRIYNVSHVERLGFIRCCRSLGMTLDEIRTLLEFKDQPRRSCSEINALLDLRIASVQAKIEELRSLEVQLRKLREQCDDARPGSECGILNRLSKGADELLQSNRSA